MLPEWVPSGVRSLVRADTRLQGPRVREDSTGCAFPVVADLVSLTFASYEIKELKSDHLSREGVLR